MADHDGRPAELRPPPRKPGPLPEVIVSGPGTPPVRLRAHLAAGRFLLAVDGLMAMPAPAQEDGDG